MVESPTSTRQASQRRRSIYGLVNWFKRSNKNIGNSHQTNPHATTKRTENQASTIPPDSFSKYRRKKWGDKNRHNDIHTPPSLLNQHREYTDAEDDSAHDVHPSVSQLSTLGFDQYGMRFSTISTSTIESTSCTSSTNSTSSSVTSTSSTMSAAKMNRMRRRSQKQQQQQPQPQPQPQSQPQPQPQPQSHLHHQNHDSQRQMLSQHNEWEKFEPTAAELKSMMALVRSTSILSQSDDDDEMEDGIVRDAIGQYKLAKPQELDFADHVPRHFRSGRRPSV